MTDIINKILNDTYIENQWRILDENDFKSSAQIIKERDERDKKRKEQDDRLNDTRNMMRKKK